MAGIIFFPVFLISLALLGAMIKPVLYIVYRATGGRKNWKQWRKAWEVEK